MAQVISLSAARKARTLARTRAQADANAAKFGRSKARKAVEAEQLEKAARGLDAHKREPE